VLKSAIMTKTQSVKYINQ